MEIFNRLMSINAKSSGDTYKPHKPLLLLIAVSLANIGKPRLILFSEYESKFNSFKDLFGDINVVFPFGRLISDDVWDVTRFNELQRNSAGELIKSDLIVKEVRGGFKEEIYSKIVSNEILAADLSKKLLDKFIDPEYHQEIYFRLHLPERSIFDGFYKSKKSNIDESRVADEIEFAETKKSSREEFVAYLNSLHSVRASGANALAESQAVNPFFGDLYEPFPVAHGLKNLLRDPTPHVVILSGHAGDGKSTVALDVYKALLDLDPRAPLKTPLHERESMTLGTHQVTIVKDMSELSAEQRQDGLRDAFADGSGSWLIVSNTGPLLNSLRQYAKDHGRPEVEDDILAQLDRPLNDEHLEQHILTGFEKPLVILNLSRFDNTELGARLLGRLIRHPGWKGCETCPAHTPCPIYLNRCALHAVSSVAEQRLRWLYRRISEYEQRLTLRQIVAQLAFSLTGGLSCASVRKELNLGAANRVEDGTESLARMVFSESFFGYREGQPFADALGLRAVELAHRMQVGGPVSPTYERRMQTSASGEWIKLPDSLQHLAETWRKARHSPPQRAALRRLLLVFGQVDSSHDGFIDALLRSPALRLLDASRQQGALALDRVAAGRLRTACLNVLREAFSGFTASQFDARDDDLYLTLRRPDRAVVQPTQLVVGSLSFRDFDLDYDRVARLPVLTYRRSRSGVRVELALALPLLDYILRRADGELGTGLDPIHQAQLDGFQAQLLNLDDARSRQEGEITLLRADISGTVDVCSYLLGKDRNGKPQLVKL